MPPGAENRSRAQAVVLVDELARCGVRHAVVAPGSRSAALAMALHEDPRLTVQVEIDERSAGFLAVGIARGSGAPAVVVTTSGTAVANLLPAVVEADAADVPVLLVTADRPPELRDTGANQTVDQVKRYGDSVRFATELGVAEDREGIVAYWRATVCRAWAESLGVSGRPGPVHINVPTREPTVPATDDGRTTGAPFTRPLTGRAGRRPWVGVTRAPRTVEEADLRGLAGRIASTERGLVVVGDTSAPLGAVADLAERAGWPLLAEPMAGLRDRAAAVSTAALLLGVPDFAARHRPDLALRFGRTGLSRGLAALLPPEVPQILVDPHGRWHDPDRSIAELIVADPGTTAATLARLLGVTAGSDWADRWHRADAHARRAVDDLLDALDGVSEPRTARDVAAAVPDGGTLVVGSSMPIRDLDSFMAPRARLRVVANRGASGIDGTVSTVLGVAVADPSRPVVGLLGDLALLHDAGGFLLRSAAEVSATFVVVQNDGGGIFSFLPPADHPLHFETVFGTPHGRDVGRLAALHDLGHERITAPDEVGPRVRAACARGGIQLLEVRTDRAANAALHRRIGRAVAEAVGGGATDEDRG